MTGQPHSAEHFTGDRDHWWAPDYLDLLAGRHGLGACRRVLELGAGVGHWTGLLLERCAPDATFLVVDRELAWIERLGARFAHLPRVTPRLADVNDLSGLDGSFDLVTCQTLLLHIDDVGGVLATARRLLAPGGLLLLAEPNNFTNRLQATPDSGLSPAEFGAFAALWWAFEIGRQRRGLGREWIAEALPGLIAAAGFVDLRVSQNDRTWARYAPYDTPDQVAVFGPPGPDAADDTEPRHAIEALALAGGLDADAFARGWAAHEALVRRTADDLAHGLYSTCGAGNLYLFAARAPRDAG